MLLDGCISPSIELRGLGFDFGESVGGEKTVFWEGEETEEEGAGLDLGGGGQLDLVLLVKWEYVL